MAHHPTSSPTSSARPFDVLHLSAGCWAHGGGLSEVVAHVALEQARAGKHVGVVFLDDAPEHPLLAQCRAEGVEVFPVHRVLRDPFFFSFALAKRLPALLRRCTFLHLHGFWTFPILLGGICARRFACPYALSPHGALCALARQPVPIYKRLFLRLVGRSILKRATWLHATSDAEAEDLRARLGEACPPIRVVPNGVDGELFDATPEQTRIKSFLFLGRLHPQKGIDLLLKAWQSAHLEGWRLLMAGAEDGFRPVPLPGVEWLGFVEGEAKARLLKSASCLVLPSYSENYGIAVAEALWCRTPVICTTGTPWTQLGDTCVPPKVDALATALRNFATQPLETHTRAFAPHFATIRAQSSWQTLSRSLLP